MDSKERFSNRADDYVKYRPSYPAEAMDYLYDVVGLRSGSLVADVGAGTGIFTKLLLERGSRVIAVEPNEAMRSKAEEQLSGMSGYQSVAGSAEETGLPDHSVDFVVCAQAFHWFDRGLAKAEFRRILRPNGKVALIWNSRLTSGTPFLEQYEELLLAYGTDYRSVNHRNVSHDGLRSFFDGRLEAAEFSNSQLFDFEGLKGRLLSSSYVPAPGHPDYEPMLEELRSIFDRTQQDGVVSFDYVTQVFWG